VALWIAEELATLQRRMIVVADTTPINYLILIEDLPVIGTVGVLREAAEMGLLDLRSAFERLRQTSFHISPAILASLLSDQP
jgi:uncharacterized protein DUF3368